MGAKAFLIHPSHQGVCWRHDTENSRVTPGDLHGSRPTGRVSDPYKRKRNGERCSCRSRRRGPLLDVRRVRILLVIIGRRPASAPASQSRGPGNGIFGFAREIQAKPGTPLWRRDETGRSFALKLTAAGLKAIAVDERPKEANEPGEASQPQLLPEAKNGVSLDDVGRHAPTAAPRDGSKLALMIDLLRRADETPYDLASEFSSPMSTYRM